MDKDRCGQIRQDFPEVRTCKKIFWGQTGIKIFLRLDGWMETVQVRQLWKGEKGFSWGQKVSRWDKWDRRYLIVISTSLSALWTLAAVRATTSSSSESSESVVPPKRVLAFCSKRRSLDSSSKDWPAAMYTWAGRAQLIALIGCWTGRGGTHACTDCFIAWSSLMWLYSSDQDKLHPPMMTHLGWMNSPVVLLLSSFPHIARKEKKGGVAGDRDNGVDCSVGRLKPLLALIMLRHPVGGSVAADKQM